MPTHNEFQRVKLMTTNTSCLGATVVIYVDMCISYICFSSSRDLCFLFPNHNLDRQESRDTVAHKQSSM